MELTYTFIGDFYWALTIDAVSTWEALTVVYNTLAKTKIEKKN